MKSKTVRELAGEIWAEINYHYRRRPDLSLDVEAMHTFLDVAMGTLARHFGEVIKNDADLPVEPLPLRPEAEESDRGPESSGRTMPH